MSESTEKGDSLGLSAGLLVLEDIGLELRELLRSETCCFAAIARWSGGLVRWRASKRSIPPSRCLLNLSGGPSARCKMPPLTMFILQVKSGSAATSASAARSRSSRASAAVRPL